MTAKHRARAGYTHDPWPCCQTEARAYGRPKGTICKDCQALIAEGRAARVLTGQSKSTGELAVYRWTSADYGWPRLYGRGIPRDDQERLQQRFWELVNRSSKQAPADTPTYSPKYTMTKTSWDDKLERRYEPWPFVLTAPEGETWPQGTWSFSILVLMPPAVRDAVNGLYSAIYEATGAAFLHGKEQGLSVLQGLASGAVSLEDFEDSLLPRDQRRNGRMRL